MSSACGHLVAVVATPGGARLERTDFLKAGGARLNSAWSWECSGGKWSQMKRMGTGFDSGAIGVHVRAMLEQESVGPVGQIMQVGSELSATSFVSASPVVPMQNSDPFDFSVWEAMMRDKSPEALQRRKERQEQREQMEREKRAKELHRRKMQRKQMQLKAMQEASAQRMALDGWPTLTLGANSFESKERTDSGVPDLSPNSWLTGPVMDPPKPSFGTPDFDVQHTRAAIGVQTPGARIGGLQDESQFLPTFGNADLETEQGRQERARKILEAPTGGLQDAFQPKSTTGNYSKEGNVWLPPASGFQDGYQPTRASSGYTQEGTPASGFQDGYQPTRASSGYTQVGTPASGFQDGYQPTRASSGYTQEGTSASGFQDGYQPTRASSGYTQVGAPASGFQDGYQPTRASSGYTQESRGANGVSSFADTLYDAVGTAATVSDDLDMLLEVLPGELRGNLLTHPRRAELLELVLDLGRRPEARFLGGGEGEYWRPEEISRDDLQAAVSAVGEFGWDNRAGIEGTLHRISAIRSRKGQIVGLTCRVGRAVTGQADMVRDVLNSGQSILILGRPGVGKTTVIREIARVLSDDLNKRVVIVDTSNEIGGDGDVPHPGIGSARRMQVPDPSMQHKVMVEAVENHMPEVVIVDEIGTEAEALACRTIAERGVMLVGTAHGQKLLNIIKNPTLCDLVGGVQSVTLGDEAARYRGTGKCVLERKAPPTFPLLIEMRERNHWVAHQTDRSVDCLLHGRNPYVEVRTRDGGFKVIIEKKFYDNSTVGRFGSDWQTTYN